MDRLLPPALLGRDDGLVRLIREHDWAATPLGPVAGWPQPLRTLVGVMLGSAQPMFVVWGPEETLLYNDAYAGILRDRHPGALGRPFLEVWRDIREDLRPIVERAYAGEPVQMDDIALTMERRGVREEAHFAFSYTPVRTEDGAIGGFFCACQETTGQVRAERRLRESEERARAEAERVQLALEAGAILGTWDWDVAADRFTADERFARSFGLDPEACRRGLTLEQVKASVHPEDLPELERALEDALARGGRYRHQYRVRDSEGRLRWIEANGRVDLGPDGRAARFPGVLLDIEARRAAEAERDRAQRLLETFAEAVPGVVYAKDRDGRMLVANRGTTQLIGKPPEAYLGRTDAEFLDDPAQARTVMANDRRIMETGRTEQVEEAVTLPDGTPAVWLSTKAPLRDKAGEVVGLIGSSIDITARKRAEAALAESEASLRETTRRLDAILNNTREAVFLMDHRQHCVYANAAAEALTGYSFAEMQGRPLHDVVHHKRPDGSHYPIEECPIDRAFPERAQMSGEELFVARDGSFYPVAFTASPVLDDAGRPVGTVIEARGIAEEKARDAALRESEERFRFALEAAGGIGTWDWDVAADRVHTSEQFARMYGIDPERARAGLPVEEYVRGIHPDDRAEVRRQIGEAVAAGGDYRAEYRILGREGQVHWVIARGRCLTDAEGRPVRFPGVTFDITARKAVEAALAESEARFRNMADHAPVMMWVTEPDGTCTYLNRGWHEFTGQTEAEALGFGWLEAVHPEDAPEARRVFLEANAKAVPFRLEYRLRRADGAWRWAIDAAAPRFGPDGIFLGYIGSVIDIHERREAEEALAASEARLRAVLEAVPVGLVFADADGRITGGNARIEEIVGHPVLPSRGVEDYGDWVSFHPDGRQVQGREYPLARALEGEERPELEVLYRRGDGRRAWVRFIASAMRDAEGQVTGGVVASLDIDRERRAEEELRHLNETLERRVAEAVAERERIEEALRQSQKMEAVGQLTGGIAHDFNNMLAAVIGSLDLLNRRVGEADARARRYVEAAMEGARRAATLTQRLLAFSRQQPLQPEPVDLNRLVQGMSDLLRRSLGAAIRLETVLGGGLWATHADRNQLENVILNLAVNARDAMPEGGRLTIETANAHLDSRYSADHLGVPPGQYVMVAVTDTGSGMTPEVMARAFDPFFTTKPVGQGTGLGLSQVYGFVKQSGGHVKLYSEPGVGTTVKIYLPRLHGAEVAPPAAGGAAELPRGEAGEVVLVVEDEAMVRQFTAEALRELGYRVLEAEGAATALRLLDAHPEVALLFTDIVMPETNGRRLADEALRRRPGLRVIFTTGYTRNAVVHNGVLDPGVHLLGKPFTVEDLAAKVREVLDGRG